jgi:hypothetical protein
MAEKKKLTAKEQAAQLAFASDKNLAECFVTNDNQVFPDKHTAGNQQKFIQGNQDDIANFKRESVEGVDELAKQLETEAKAALAEHEKATIARSKAEAAAKAALNGK